MPAPPQQPDSTSGSASGRAVGRISAILRAFTASKPTLSLTEVARATDLDKNTTRRLLLALAENGLVWRHAETGLFELDVAILKMQPAVLRPRELRETAAAFLHDLTAATGMTAFAWRPDAQGALCVERARTHGVTVDEPWSSPGSTLALNMAAGPRVILAHIEPGARADWLRKEQPAFTPLSQTDPVRLEQEAARIRAQGYECIASDFVMGLAGLGVPLFDRNGLFVGAISITGRATDFEDEERRDAMLARLREAASAIGVRMGTFPGQ